MISSMLLGVLAAWSWPPPGAGPRDVAFIFGALALLIVLVVVNSPRGGDPPP